jgi:ZIP family zinc transporter
MAKGIGSIIAFTARRTDYRFLSVATGFSAGVMLYVSFGEILYKGLESLSMIYGPTWGTWVNTAAFFSGILLIAVIDNLVPAASNPHETHAEQETAWLHLPADGTGPAGEDPSKGDTGLKRNGKLMRMGLFTALAISVHNFPEGLATFLAALKEPGVGVAIALAVALHNIPEGISVSVPIFYATGDRRRAFVYSFLSGLAEPFGAGIAYLALRFFTGTEAGVIPPQVMGVLFGGGAGIMVYISLDELLPTSRAYGKGHDGIFGLIAGMVVMALSLLLMR